MRRVYKNLCLATISASTMAANMWKNSFKNVESDNNKILYETLLDFFLHRNGTYFLNKPRSNSWSKKKCCDVKGTVNFSVAVHGEYKLILMHLCANGGAMIVWQSSRLRFLCHGSQYRIWVVWKGGKRVGKRKLFCCNTSYEKIWHHLLRKMSQCSSGISVLPFCISFNQSNQ